MVLARAPYVEGPKTFPPQDQRNNAIGLDTGRHQAAIGPGSRPYILTLGRWLSAHASGPDIPDNLNGYQYANDDPINNVDAGNGAKPCSSKDSLSQRITKGIQGAANMGVGTIKAIGFGTATVGTGAAAPETGGLSLLGTAYFAYQAATALPQIASGAAEVYNAINGETPEGEQLEQGLDILTNPISGVSTLAITQNPAAAQQAADFESLFTAGSGLVNSKTAGDIIQNGVDLGLSATGLAGNGGCDWD